jgi:hypothetical protein
VLSQAWGFLMSVWVSKRDDTHRRARVVAA